MGYAIVGCSKCKQKLIVELRNATSSCTRCQASYTVRKRQRFWEGDSAHDARAALLAMGPSFEPPKLLPRHDNPLDAAAAKARGERNLSRRAETVALWLHRLAPPMQHEPLIDGMERAGIPAERAEKEIIRMLAMDILMEPRPHQYTVLDD